MARPLRINFENAVYHIITRGNRKEKIFYSDEDKLIFQKKMNKTFLKYSFICYAYCLLDNHYHLFLKTPNANLSKGMHYLNVSYANYFSAKYRLSGPLFQGRYKSILVDQDQYSLVLSSYIHLNPYRAGIKDWPNYPASSLPVYLGRRKPVIENLDSQFILQQFHPQLPHARRLYLQYIMNNLNLKYPQEEIKYSMALGDESFIKKIEQHISSYGKDREIQVTNLVFQSTSTKIITLIANTFQINSEELLTKRRGNIYRLLAIYLIKNHTALSLKEVGEIFSMDYTAVSQAAKRFEAKISKDKSLKKKVVQILEKINIEMSNVKT
jgi:REP element-mobilizing transposase RayT